jgi:hypothetical protein
METSKDFWIVLWSLIEESRGSKKRLKRLLSSKPRGVLITFHKEFQRAIGNLGMHLEAPGSADMQKDIFSHVVSRGADFYDEVLAHPERLPQDVGPRGVDFYGVAGEVFWERFQEEITLQ